MSIVDALRNVDEIVVGVEVGSLDISVALAVREEGSHSPAVAHKAGRNRNTFLVHTVVTHAIPHGTALLGIERASGDVDSTTHRRSRDDSSTKTALSLHGRSNIAQTGPVAPIYASPFHIIDRNTIDEHSHVGSLEATHIDFRIAITTAVFGSPYTRCSLQDFGELLVTEFHVDSCSIHFGDSHRSDTSLSHRRSDNDVVEHS